MRILKHAVHSGFFFLFLYIFINHSGKRYSLQMALLHDKCMTLVTPYPRTAYIAVPSHTRIYKLATVYLIGIVCVHEYTYCRLSLGKVQPYVV